MQTIISIINLCSFETRSMSFLKDMLLYHLLLINVNVLTLIKEISDRGFSSFSTLKIGYIEVKSKIDSS